MASPTSTEPPDPARAHPAAADTAEAGRAAADRLADVAHEMRGPLGAVIALGDLLLARDLDAGDRRVVELIRLAGRHLLGLADDLAGPDGTGPDGTGSDGTGRNGTGQDGTARTPPLGRVAPGDMARSVAALYAPLIGAAGLRVSVDVEPGLPDHVPANETWLRQVLVNFVSNALKFAATEVRVRVAVEGTDVVFSVLDDGPRLGAATGGVMDGRPDPVTGRAGSGRGLAIARRLAGALGGTLALSGRPEGGTCAAFRLPLATADGGATTDSGAGADEAPRAIGRARAGAGRPRTGRRLLGVRRRIRRRPVRGPADAAGVSLKGMAVLVVDDSLVSRLLMLTILESFDMRVVAVTSGAEAEAEVRRRRPDLVCLDWTLDGETGESVRCRLEEVLGPAMPPAIAITGLATAPRLPEAGWQGGPVVAKPFSPRELHLAIETALAPQSATRAPGHGRPS
ncbi:hybrid sensor histidine kinase/response regulator [Mongoliimonas terrestris]|uniref:hybrid sensor histidine kinase/response regulator n=1 Tax=Mongoliimonas terrestris TaxID=1709001 RepID=UPI0009497DD4|nr:hybrid sensor histidine kinase/response regulator [Mongoliimonas terrestris]